MRHNELTVCDGCVMWGSHVVVPQAGHKNVMKQLHGGHPGTSRKKSLARSFVWWPQMDDDIHRRWRRGGRGAMVPQLFGTL